MAEIGYDPEADVVNPTGSVFCAHGAGFQVSWDRCRICPCGERLEAGEGRNQRADGISDAGLQAVNSSRALFVRPGVV